MHPDLELPEHLRRSQRLPTAPPGSLRRAGVACRCSTRPDAHDPSTTPGGSPMPVLTRSAARVSPLADLHEIASELGLDGFRRLRKAELVDTILNRQEGGGGQAAVEDGEVREVVATRARGRARPRSPRRSRKTRRRRGAEGPYAPRRARPRAPAATRIPAGRGDKPAERGACGVDGRGRRRPARQRLGLPGALPSHPAATCTSPLRRCAAASSSTATASSGPVRQPRRSELPAVARARRHHQRPSGRRGRRGHAVRGFREAALRRFAGARRRRSDTLRDRPPHADQPRLA